jgi:hypothetical protein
VSLVAFSGPRDLPPACAPVVAGTVARVLAAGSVVAVGCARGADEYVRRACPVAQVFSVASGRFGSGVAALVRRSVALVEALEANEDPALVAFVSSACPPGLVPSPRPGRCFAGFGSGTWATVALAAGKGIPVFVFWFGPGAPALPGWRAWRLVSDGPLAGAWRWQP